MASKDATSKTTATPRRTMKFPGVAKLEAWLRKNTDKAVVLKHDGTIWKTSKMVFPQQWKKVIDQDKFELRATSVGSSGSMHMYCAGSMGYTPQQVEETRASLGDAFVDAFAGKQSDWDALPPNVLATRLASQYGTQFEVRGNAVFDVEKTSSFDKHVPDWLEGSDIR